MEGPIHSPAIVCEAVDTAVYHTVEIPLPGPGEVLVRAAYTAISPGTELRCMAGLQDPGPFEPFVPGYSMVGHVESVGEGAALEIGTPVFCCGTERLNRKRQWGAHTQYAVARESSVYVLPAGADLVACVLTKLLAIALRGFETVHAGAGESTLVLGLGPIGFLSALCHHRLGEAGGVLCADRLEERVELAHQCGLEAATLDSAGLEAIRGKIRGGSADVIVDATGVPAVIPEAIALARDLPWDDSDLHLDGSLQAGTAYLLQGSYAGTFTVPYLEAFLKEMRFFLTRDGRPRDMRRCIELISEGTIDPTPIITEILSPADCDSAYRRLREREKGLMTFAFAWDSSRL